MGGGRALFGEEGGAGVGATPERPAWLGVELRLRCPLPPPHRRNHLGILLRHHHPEPLPARCFRGDATRAAGPLEQTNREQRNDRHVEVVYVVVELMLLCRAILTTA